MTTKIQKKNQVELNKGRALISRKKSNSELIQNERFQKRENMIENIDLGKIF